MGAQGKYKSTFSQGFAPNSTKGVRPLDTHDGFADSPKKTTTKKEIKKFYEKNRGFFAHSVEYIKEERKRMK
jgi:hypothetical protein